MTIGANPAKHPGMTLLSITSEPAVAAMLERCGVDWVFVDLEIIGKQERQAGRNTVVSGHSLDDVRAVRQAISRSKLLVRVNPWGEWSPAEIDGAVEAGADVLMLPFFKGKPEVQAFVEAVDGRARTSLLLETAEAVRNVDEILSVCGIDYVHIGLNDLHLAYGMTFMFEPLADGTVDRLCEAFARAGVTYGFGGMARIGSLRPPAEDVIAEHFRLGSSMVILSRSFCDFGVVEDPLSLELELERAVDDVRACEARLRREDAEFFARNRESVVADIGEVVARIRHQANGDGLSNC
jgi:2-keto-3-deoxy-L-rhamnonate aldolase RhmA